MKQCVFVFCLYFGWLLNGFAQRGGGHNVYLEAAGSSLLYGFNYEYAFKIDDKSFLAPKIGLGYMPKLASNFFFSNWSIVSPGVNYFIGGGRSKIEAGAYATITTHGRRTETYPGFLIGMRDISGNGNLFRANFSPFIYAGKIYPMLGVSFGKNF